MSTTKTKKKSKIIKYLRLPIDEKLEEMLAYYEIKYRFLNRVDIIKMLLCKADPLGNQIASFIQSLPKPETDFTEDQIFSIVEDWNKNKV